MVVAKLGRAQSEMAQDIARIDCRAQPKQKTCMLNSKFQAIKNNILNHMTQWNAPTMIYYRDHALIWLDYKSIARIQNAGIRTQKIRNLRDQLKRLEDSARNSGILRRY
jgi:hypothetical protein